jgi:hypothetical protein
MAQDNEYLQKLIAARRLRTAATSRELWRREVAGAVAQVRVSDGAKPSKPHPAR